MSENKPVSKRLFIGALPYRFTEGELLSLFIPEGKIISVRIMHNKWGKSRGIGYIEFENLEDAIRAKEKFHNFRVDEDRTIIVDYAAPDPFLTPEGQARHEEAIERHPNRHQSRPFLPHPDSDVSDYREQKQSFDNRQYPPRRLSSDRPSFSQEPRPEREYKGGKPAFNSLGKSLNRNTTGEYVPKFFPESFAPKKRYIAPSGQKPEYKSSSPSHVRSSVFKQRNFGSKIGAKFAFKSKKNK
jgi:RNA recognition motif-containing protein